MNSRSERRAHCGASEVARNGRRRTDSANGRLVFGPVWSKSRPFGCVIAVRIPAFARNQLKELIAAAKFLDAQMDAVDARLLISTIERILNEDLDLWLASSSFVRATGGCPARFLGAGPVNSERPMLLLVPRDVESPEAAEDDRADEERS